MTHARERHSDVLDVATDLTMRENAFLIADSALRAAPRQVQVKDDFGNLYWPVMECVDCDDELEDHRLPSTRCIFCQEKLELKERTHAHR